MTIEAMKLALEALEGFIPYLPLPDKTQCGRYDKAITALRAAIEQAQKPRQWQWLTHKEIVQAKNLSVNGDQVFLYSFARAIEAKLKEKNNA